MLCQRCNKKVATVFISTIVNGHNSQMYLCTDCAKEFHDSMSTDMQIPFPINDILSNMEFDEDTINSLIKDFKNMEDNGEFREINNNNNNNQNQNNINQSSVEPLSQKKEEEEIICSFCNTSFEEYKKTGKLGCSKCYSTFKKQLKPIIEGIYGYSEHIGKFPKDEFKDIQAIRTVEQLKEQLNIAIQKEEYEQAAKLRDEILELETNEM